MTRESDFEQPRPRRDPGLFGTLFLRIYASFDAARFMADPASNAFVAGLILTQWIVGVSALVVLLIGQILNRPFSTWGFVGLGLALYVSAELGTRDHEDEQFHDALLMARYRSRLERSKTFLILALPFILVLVVM